MEEHALFLKFWDKEEPTTGKVLSRIPEGDYKPDPKSRTAREIAWLLVTEQRVLVDGLEKSRMEWVDVPAPAVVRRHCPAVAGAAQPPAGRPRPHGQ